MGGETKSQRIDHLEKLVSAQPQCPIRFRDNLYVSPYPPGLIFPLTLLWGIHAALPKELPATPAKFLTGACLTRSEDLWITAEAGGVYRLSGQENETEVGGYAEAAGGG